MTSMRAFSVMERELPRRSTQGDRSTIDAGDGSPESLIAIATASARPPPRGVPRQRIVECRGMRMLGRQPVVRGVDLSARGEREVRDGTSMALPTAHAIATAVQI